MEEEEGDRIVEYEGPAEESVEERVAGVDEDWSDDEEQPIAIQLGFVEALDDAPRPPVLFEDADWRNWDGGKVGGKPVRVIALSVSSVLIVMQRIRCG